MNISAAMLRQLHRIHRQTSDLRERLERGPQQVKAAQAHVEHLEQQLKQVHHALTRARVASDEKQLQLKQREDRIQDLKFRLNTCSSNREYQLLREQIAADEQANSVLSDEILEMLERIDQLQAKQAGLQKQLDKARLDQQDIQQRVETQQRQLQAELERVTGDLRKAEAELPSDFKADYDRMTRSRGEDAMAPVDGESCGNCNQILSPQTLHELRMERPVFCKSCGCLLYLAEEP